MALVSMTALPLALCTGLAESRGVGITHQAMLQVQDLRSVGRAMNAPNDFPVMASQSAGLIVAERTPVHVSATEAASLLDDLRLQLAAQPNARLSIHWRLTQPAEIK
ncbi:MAG: hypothetical protein ACRED2_10845 [Methylocella sp.]